MKTFSSLQEVVVKEKLAASGKPLRKFASTPNLLQGVSTKETILKFSPVRI